MGQFVRVFCPVNLRDGDRVVWLVGASSLPLTVLSALRCLHYDEKALEPDFLREADDLRLLLPRGLEVLGAIVVSEKNAEEGFEFAGDFACKIRRALQTQSEAAVVAGGASNHSRQIEYRLYSPGDTPRLETLQLSEDAVDLERSLWTNFGLLRCQMELVVPLYLANPPTSSDFEEQLEIAIDHLMGDLKSSRIVLLAKGSNTNAEQQGAVLIQPFNQLRSSNGPEARLGDPSKESVQQSSHFSDLTLPPYFIATTSGTQIPQPVEMTVMLQQSRVTQEKATAPVVQYLPATQKEVTIQMLKLSMAVVCMGGSRERLVDVATDLVLPALRDQLTAMHKIIARNAIRNAKTDYLKVQISAYPFCPPGWVHPITAIYDLTHGEMELALVQERKGLHQRLGLALDRPMLRAANAVIFRCSDGSGSRSGGRLSNVHVGLPNSGVLGGRQSQIDGSYEYYHYLQDRIDDDGWGCAYRSLQTIVSWFRLQQYTTVQVPSHRDVQQTLVDIEDKDPSFVGSQEWIGAIELSFVLDKLLGVSCKILNVRTGADMPSHCRELAHHFQTQGTPVMIGGGVLAYTLLGVDYNESTGDSAFLILDPHYTGGEDLKAIRNGGWCGWKKAITKSGRPFFLPNKFYNLLLPQRPSTV